MRPRGLRITVWDVLGWLCAWMTEEQILDEHPDLEKADFAAVYQFAADAGRRDCSAAMEFQSAGLHHRS